MQFNNIIFSPLCLRRISFAILDQKPKKVSFSVRSSYLYMENMFLLAIVWYVCQNKKSFYQNTMMKKFCAKSSLSIFVQKYLCKCEDIYFILQNKYLYIYEDSFGAKILLNDCALNVFNIVLSIL